eukprot:scaffold65774_cov61-Phaeocystis_antarctica.AAC.6
MSVRFLLLEVGRGPPVRVRVSRSRPWPTWPLAGAPAAASSDAPMAPTAAASRCIEAVAAAPACRRPPVPRLGLGLGLGSSGCSGVP